MFPSIVVAIPIAGLLLVPFIMVSYFETSSAVKTSVLTTTVYVPRITDDSGNSLALNTVLIYNATRSRVLTVQESEITSTFFSQQVVSILGSGLVVRYKGKNYIATNDNVARSSSNLTDTFSDGDSYAKHIGTNPYTDLAVLSVANVPAFEFEPLNLTTSSYL